MSLGVGALVRCNERFVAPALPVEGFVSHPFRKEQRKGWGTRRYTSTRLSTLLRLCITL
jgi:hypothetical protein